MRLPWEKTGRRSWKRRLPRPAQTNPRQPPDLGFPESRRSAGGQGLIRTKRLWFPDPSDPSEDLDPAQFAARFRSCSGVARQRWLRRTLPTVVSVAHAGLDVIATPDVARSFLPVQCPVPVHGWRTPTAGIPNVQEAHSEWLFGQWERMDRLDDRASGRGTAGRGGSGQEVVTGPTYVPGWVAPSWRRTLPPGQLRVTEVVSLGGVMTTLFALNSTPEPACQGR